MCFFPGLEFNSTEEPYDFQFAKWMTREKVIVSSLTRQSMLYACVCVCVCVRYRV